MVFYNSDQECACILLQVQVSGGSDEKLSPGNSRFGFLNMDVSDTKPVHGGFHIFIYEYSNLIR